MTGWLRTPTLGELYDDFFKKTNKDKKFFGNSPGKNDFVTQKLRKKNELTIFWKVFILRNLKSSTLRKMFKGVMIQARQSIFQPKISNHLNQLTSFVKNDGEKSHKAKHLKVCSIS